MRVIKNIVLVTLLSVCAVALAQTADAKEKPDVQVDEKTTAVPDVGNITGKVFDAKEQGVSGAIVFLCDQSSGIPISKKTLHAFTEDFGQQNMNVITTATDDNGAFSFEDIPNGRYRLVSQSWRNAKEFKGTFEVNGKEIELHGIAKDIQVSSESSPNVVLRPLGAGILQIDEKMPNNETLLVISTEPTRADSILGFAGWSGRFMQNMIGGNRMPSGKTTIYGLPEGKIYLAMFAGDSVPGWADGETDIQTKKTTVLNYIQFVNSWSNSRHTPPEHLLPLFEEMKLLLVEDKAFLQKLFANHGVGFEASKMWDIQKQISQHLQKEIELPAGNKALFGDVVAAAYYIQLEKVMERKREKAKKRAELIEK